MFYPKESFVLAIGSWDWWWWFLNLGETTEGDVAEFPEIVDDGGGG